MSISQIYETTVADATSGLSAHFVVAPSRSLGGESYLFSRDEGALQALGMQELADIPAGGVVRSLAVCLMSSDADDFLRRFDEEFARIAEHPSVHLPPAFAFAEYLTFARVIPFEWTSTFTADSLGNLLTAQGYGRAAYACHEETRTPVLVVLIPAGILLCGSAGKVQEALAAGLRESILSYSKAPEEG
ncbi:hypothetical protein Rxyl_1591 [Rubrobacter xylanophilus DSM 9941]|uniref:Uncharacterized protein n=2 Tax=Rubrobacter xylanophilus TaxID=49319 RepID=Q1AVM5_RUBXD|nr:hypothetical protein Rxyl_1591 [Rubrobacter xylanophilus DSM 9941]